MTVAQNWFIILKKILYWVCVAKREALNPMLTRLMLLLLVRFS